MWNPYRSERVTLHTSLTPEECIQRIQASIRSFWYDSASDAPFFGSVNGCTFTVYKARLFGRRGVRANAEGEIAAERRLTARGSILRRPDRGGCAAPPDVLASRSTRYLRRARRIVRRAPVAAAAAQCDMAFIAGSCSLWSCVTDG